MAAAGHLPVYLRVGETESHIGTLEIELRLDSAPISYRKVGVTATVGDIRPTLAAFLRKAADTIEQAKAE